MAVSPWAQIAANAPLATPPPGGPWAPVDQPLPDVSSLGAPAPKVAEDPIAQNIGNDQQQLQNVRWHEAHHWGTPENHPGKLGKLAHVFSEIGNIAGNIVAPATMANIPGTQLNMKEREGGLTNRLNDELKQSNQEQGQDATTAHTRQETELEPGKAKSLEDYQNSETNKNNELAAMGPSLAQGYSYAVTKAIKENRDPTTDPVVQHFEDAIQAIQPTRAIAPKGLESKPGVFNGKPAFGNFHPDTGVYTDQAGNAMPGFQPQPQPGLLPPWIFNPQGNDVERPKPGQPLPSGFTTPNQTGQGNTKMEQLKLYQPALDSSERMNVMTDAYEKAVKNGDQQAMLNLLANHLGMTMGLQKGARMTRDIIHEAETSQPYLQGLKARWSGPGADAYLTGVVLAPPQMRQMVNLGQERYAEDVKKSRAQAQYLGAQDDGPPRIPGAATINYYKGLAQGNGAKAKQLAEQDGWTISGSK